MRTVVVVLTACAVLAGALYAASRIWGGHSHTKASRLPYTIEVLGAKIESYRVDAGVYPATLGDLTNSRPPVPNPELGPYAKLGELSDPWQRAYYYRVDESGKGFLLFSLGADGAIGGTGENKHVQYNAAADES
jgi:general secretion pathway protein G